MSVSRRAVALAVLSSLACSGGEDDPGGVVITTVSEYGHTPVAGVHVQVGDEEWKTTDQAGRVAFDVEPPYDLRLLQRVEIASRLHQDVWELVDQTERVLTIPVDGSTQPTHESSVSGQVSGVSGAGSHVAVFGGRYPATGAVGTVEEDGTFQLAGFRWEGSPSQSFNLHALESNGGDLPTLYSAFGTASVQLEDDGEGATATATIALAPIDETEVTGSVAVPDGIAPSLRPSMTLTLPDGSWITLGEGAALTPGDFEFAVPDLDRATVRLEFLAGGVSGDGLRPPTARFAAQVALPAKQLAVELPPAIRTIAPAEGALIDGATRFRWEPQPGGHHYGLALTCQWDGGSVNYRVVQTTDTEVALPAIPGLEVAAGAACAWSVGWFDGAQSLIESVTPPPALRSSWSGERSATHR